MIPSIAIGFLEPGWTGSIRVGIGAVLAVVSTTPGDPTSSVLVWHDLIRRARRVHGVAFTGGMTEQGRLWISAPVAFTLSFIGTVARDRLGFDGDSTPDTYIEAPDEAYAAGRVPELGISGAPSGGMARMLPVGDGSGAPAGTLDPARVTMRLTAPSYLVSDVHPLFAMPLAGQRFDIWTQPGTARPDRYRITRATFERAGQAGGDRAMGHLVWDAEVVA